MPVKSKTKKDGALIHLCLGGAILIRIPLAPPSVGARTVMSMWAFLLGLILESAPWWAVLLPAGLLAYPSIFWMRAVVAEQRFKEASFTGQLDDHRNERKRKNTRKRKSADKRS